MVKKCYYALMVMLMALVSVGFAACGDDDSDLEIALIVGTWQYDNPEMFDDAILLFQFTKDRKFHQVAKYIGEEGTPDYFAFHGTYTVKGYKLIVTIDPTPLFNDESETIEFSYSVEGDKLELLSNGETITLKRVNASAIEPYL